MQPANLEWLSESFQFQSPPLSSVLVEVAPSVSIQPSGIERIVFLITKDQPERLRLTLPALVEASDRVYVIDSSRSRQTRDLCFEMNARNLVYHGAEDQAREIASQPVLQKALAAHLITDLSANCWDIWSKRNYILLFSLLNGFPNILMVDDDVIPPPGLVDDVLSLSRSYNLVGANICGMRDVSVVEHICNLRGLSGRDFISGHFLAVNVCAAAQYFFFDIYNEDWVFIMLNSMTGQVARYGTIFHLFWNPFSGTERRAASEEKGEIFIDGLAGSLLSGKGVAPLQSVEHWETVLADRQEALEKLARDEMVRSLPVLGEILASAQSVTASLSAMDLVKLWKDYCNQLDEWRAIIGLVQK